MLVEQKYTEKELSDYYEAMKEKKSTIIYDSTRETLMHNMQCLQELQNQGVSVGALKEETWEQIKDLIESSDRQMCKRRLKELREEINKEVIIGC